MNKRKRNHFRMGSSSKITHAVNYDSSPKFVEVIPNQSVTPAQMLDMAKQGIPISSDNAAAIDGELNPSWDLPLEKQKHIDPADLWQAQQSVRKKIRDAHAREKKARKPEEKQ